MIDHYLDDGLEAAAARNGRPRPSLAQRLQSYPPVQEELDLHGLKAEEAEKALRRFVEHCLSLRLATLRIITGKGLHSPGPPVLPPVTEAVLQAMKQEKKVLAYRWEKKRSGRSGALIVYLP
ncbi:Smr/MutS family protein [Desulfurivibrio sp. C05AmB]|uniref:Smr/MutS family protein n=1 Tax=Desulfurivibrio sp. C05AmB TaxID=3374371 RepID=UPI00376EFCF7